MKKVLLGIFFLGLTGLFFAGHAQFTSCTPNTGGVTPNIGLQLPSAGACGWGVLLNQNFSALDTAINILNGEVGNSALVKDKFGPLGAQSASISATSFCFGNCLPGSEFRVHWFVHVTRAASSSSSVQVQINFNDSGFNLNCQGANVNGNTTTSFDQGTCIFHSDDGAITWQTTYASSGGTTMQYEVEGSVERVF